MKTEIINRFLVLILSAIFSSGLCRADALQLRGITSTNGLSDLVVNCIYKDSVGYIWFGTGTGLDRFDGSVIKSYPVPGENAMQKRILAISQAADGTIIAGNGDGLYMLAPESDHLVPLLADKINFRVNALASRDGKVFAATERGLFIIDISNGKSEYLMPHTDALSQKNALNDITIDGYGDIWLSSPDGILLYKDGQLRHFHHGNKDLTLNKISPIAGKIYISTHGRGLLSLNPSTGDFHPEPAFSDMLVSSLSARGDSALYVGTDGNGVFVYSPLTGCLSEHFSHDSRHGEMGTLRSNSVYSLLADADGLLWIGYYQAGVDYTPSRRDIFEVYRFDSFDSAEKTVRALAIDGYEKLIGTREGLYYIDEKKHQVDYIRTPAIRANMIFAITKYQGEYYIGTYNGGIYVFNPVTGNLRDLDHGTEKLRGSAVFAIVPDAANNLWIGTSQGLVCYKDGRVAAHYTDANSRLPHGNVYEIFFDSAGRGWICTDNGLAIWDGHNIRDDGFPKGFPHKEKYRDIYESTDHTLYFVPDKGRIFGSNLALTEFGYPQIFGIEENPTISFVKQDNTGKLWIGQNNGLVCYDAEGQSYIFSDVDGLPGTIFTLCPPVLDSNGDIWLGNSRGLIHLDYDRMPMAGHGAGHALVSEVRVNGKSVPMPLKNTDRTVIAVSEDNATVTFRFADLSYINPESQIYEYRLEGQDESWKLLSGQSEATYYDIPRGHYTMRVRYAGDADSETSVQVKVESGIDWVQVMLTLLLVMSVAAAIYFYLQHRRHKTARELSASESNRDEPVKYRTSRLSDKECKILFKRLEELMRSQKPYINPDLKIADLAATLSTSAHTMSFLFNQYLDRNYYDYINEYRVQEFKRMVANGDTARYTLTAMSELCGFSSRASFFRHFKKACGVTPSQYIKDK